MPMRQEVYEIKSFVLGTRRIYEETTVFLIGIRFLDETFKKLP